MSNDAWLCLLFLAFGFFFKVGVIAADSIFALLADLPDLLKKKRDR